MKYQSLYVNFADKKQRRSPSNGRFIGKITGSIVLILLLAGALGKVYFDRQTQKMVREWQTIYEQLNVLKKETENLKMEREKYMSGHYILREAEKLNLRPSEPGQVRVMNDPILSKSKPSRMGHDSLIASR